MALGQRKLNIYGKLHNVHTIFDMHSTQVLNYFLFVWYYIIGFRIYGLNMKLGVVNLWIWAYCSVYPILLSNSFCLFGSSLLCIDSILHKYYSSSLFELITTWLKFVLLSFCFRKTFNWYRKLSPLYIYIWEFTVFICTTLKCIKSVKQVGILYFAESDGGA